MAAVVWPAADANAKTPGTVHCYGGWCHRINSIDEMDGMVGRHGVVTASYYDDCSRDRFNTCGLTSSGAIFRADRPDNAASPVFPDGTVLLAYNPETKLAAVVRVTSAGPYRGDRTLDVSRATAERLGFAKRGVAPLEIAILKSPAEDEARYKKLREYAQVPGFIGHFPTFEDAHDTAVARMGLETAGFAVASAAGQLQMTLPPLAGTDAVLARLPPDMVAISEAALVPVLGLECIEVTDAGAQSLLTALTLRETDVDPAVRPPLVALARPVQPSFWQRAAAFIERARVSARPRSSGGAATPAIQAEVRPLRQRLADFISIAQAKARLGVRAPAAGTIASR